MSPSPIVDHVVLDPLELAHLDGSPTVKGDFANGSIAAEVTARGQRLLFAMRAPEQTVGSRPT
jgi:hypothetical protein